MKSWLELIWALKSVWYLTLPPLDLSLNFDAAFFDYDQEINKNEIENLTYHE